MKGDRWDDRWVEVAHAAGEGAARHRGGAHQKAASLHFGWSVDSIIAALLAA